ncbi:unnamed protein product [Symbiodinium sp. KB8]|nr:unnamed protein product [Symbiodinium sp. KB8]
MLTRPSPNTGATRTPRATTAHASAAPAVGSGAGVAPALETPVRVAVQGPAGRSTLSVPPSTTLADVLRRALPDAALAGMTITLMRRALQHSDLDKTMLELGVGSGGALFRVTTSAPASQAPAASPPQPAPATTTEGGASESKSSIQDAQSHPTPPLAPSAAEAVARTAVEALRSAAFDEDSLATLSLVLRLLDNVLKAPGRAERRAVRLANPKIANCIGKWPPAVALLLAAGFLPTRDAPDCSEVLLRTAPAESHATLAPTVLATAARLEQPGDPPRLALLPWAEDSDAVVAVRSVVAQEISTMTGTPAPPLPDAQQAASTFDIYSSSSFSTAPQAASVRAAAAGPSLMEQRLAKLQAAEAAARAALPFSAASPPPRDTQAILPSTLPGYNPGKFLPADKPTGIPVVPPTPGRQAKSGVSDGAAVLAIAKARADAAEKASRFSSQAERDVQALQRKVLYPKTLLRVQLPDRTVLQGCFAPDEPIAAVLAWLGDCMQDGVVDKAGMAVYISPPRRTLPSTGTLEAEGLVPSALLYASIPPPHTPSAADTPFRAEDVLLPSLLGSSQATHTQVRQALEQHRHAAANQAQTAQETAPTPQPAPQSTETAKSARELREARLEAMAQRMLGGRRKL